MSISGTISSYFCGPWGQGGYGHGWFGGGYGHGGFGMGSGAWFGGFHFPFGLLTLVLLAVGAFWLFSRSRTPVPQENPAPLDILKRRYAAGEISREEFQRQRSEINS